MLLSSLPWLSSCYYHRCHNCHHVIIIVVMIVIMLLLSLSWLSSCYYYRCHDCHHVIIIVAKIVTMLLSSLPWLSPWLVSSDHVSLDHIVCYVISALSSDSSPLNAHHREEKCQRASVSMISFFQIIFGNKGVTCFIFVILLLLDLIISPHRHTIE